jgi:hypothetical protein
MTGKPSCPVRREAARNRTCHGRHLAARPTQPAWLTAHRRLARDYETSPAHSETMIRWAMIGIMVRRLTRGCPAARPGPKPLIQVRSHAGTVQA